MASEVEASYSRRADEYAKHFGSIATVHPSDVQLVTTWADQIDGSLLDAGCGPGHWTNYLSERGVDVHGVDQVEGFIGHAREAYPGVPFEVGTIDELTNATRSIGGIFAWYSLIHHSRETIQLALSEFARVLRPKGGLLVGFFVGPTVEPFDHAIVTGYRWSPEALADELRKAGFEIIETHTRTGFHPRPRPHGAIVAGRP